MVDVVASTKAIKNIRRHFCVVLQYCAATRIGVLLLGTSRPHQPHRFVPCLGTKGLPHQPRHFVSLSPACGLMNTGYFNFSHALRATIVLQGDTVLRQSVPPQAFLTEKYADGTNIDVFLDRPEVEGLKSLHATYWEGVRYDTDGLRVGAGGRGPKGSGDGSSGGFGGGGRASSGAYEEDDGPTWSHASFFRPLRADGTISLPNPHAAGRGSGAERLARALTEEDVRVAQLDLIGGGHMDLPAAYVYAFFQPLTVSALDIVDPL